MTGLLRPPLLGGVYEVADSAGLATALREAGWHVGTTDLSDPRTAVALLGDELGFPDYYGKNLDALHDSLSGLTRPTALLVRVPLAASSYAHAMLEVLEDRAASSSEVPFALVRLSRRTGSPLRSCGSPVARGPRLRP